MYGHVIGERQNVLSRVNINVNLHAYMIQLRLTIHSIDHPIRRAIVFLGQTSIDDIEHTIARDKFQGWVTYAPVKVYTAVSYLTCSCLNRQRCLYILYCVLGNGKNLVSHR